MPDSEKSEIPKITLLRKNFEKCLEVRSRQLSKSDGGKERFYILIKNKNKEKVKNETHFQIHSIIIEHFNNLLKT